MNSDIAEIVRKQAGDNKILYGENRSYRTTDEYVTIVYGAPKTLQYMHGGADIYFYNKGSNAFDYRVLESARIGGLLIDTEELSDSNMIATLSGTVSPADDPPNAGSKQLLVSRPTYIKIQVKSTVAGQPSVVDVEFKGTEA